MLRLLYVFAVLSLLFWTVAHDGRWPWQPAPTHGPEWCEAHDAPKPEGRDLRSPPGDDHLALRVEAVVEGISVPVLGLNELIANKKATGRDKDRADVEGLQGKS